MGTIKDIYDVTKDGVIYQRQIKAIKRALRAEAKLNREILSDIERSKQIDNDRRIKIINNLELNELADAVKLEIPYRDISRRNVSKDMLGKISLDRAIGDDLEKVIEKLYLKIAYLQRDYDNTYLDINSRLHFIFKYNILLLRLLE